LFRSKVVASEWWLFRSKWWIRSKVVASEWWLRSKWWIRSKWWVRSKVVVSEWWLRSKWWIWGVLWARYIIAKTVKANLYLIWTKYLRGIIWSVKA